MFCGAGDAEGYAGFDDRPGAKIFVPAQFGPFQLFRLGTPLV
ncbi:hypothetical protein RISK_000902 [Rhodopirellula islandica]|uniref:Uncharacterized protein n=1 Tax=Rhodopirellula islandica TaxID=595434 RepID=A0A0J1BKN9_RHOIS|nr:hypothetical protein RISK_000902 [Rhodopirellula islandica]